MERKTLFDGADPTLDGEYTSRAHLAQIIGLLDPPPEELLARGTKSGLHFNANGMSHVRTPPILLNNAESSGEFMAPSINPRRGLSDTVTTIGGEEKEEFLRFASRMLQWLPERRATAQELLDDPWMRSLD